MFLRDRADDVVDGGDVARMLLPRAQVVHELLGGEPLGFGQRRSEHPGDTTSSAPPNERAKSSWNTRRQDEAERGSKTAQMRRSG